MKHKLLYIAAAALASSAALSSCDDNFTHPPVIMPPSANVEPTATLADVKADYWSTLSAPTTIGYDANGDTIIFTGRVCSTDESSNIYKSIIVQTVDENGEQLAINFSVNSYDLYQLFPFGQEVAVYATGLSIGGYRNLLQFGAISGSEMTFMDADLFTAHVIRNGSALPEPSKVDTTVTTIPEVIAAKSDNAQLMRWQSRLIRIDNVSWEDAGQPYAGATTANRYIVDAEGNRLNVRNSSYSSFKNDILPYGTGSVVGILSYYASDWQVLLNDTTGCIGFDNIAPEPDPDAKPAVPAGSGTAADPYNVAKALEVIAAGPSESNVYVQGKISKITELDYSNFGNATYNITDEGTGNSLIVYRGYWYNGDKFTSADQLEVGADVIVCGVLVNFYGNTPEFTQGNYVYSYNGKTAGGSEPAQPAENELYSMLGESSAEIDWTLDNGTLPEGLSYLWDWKEYNKAYYLNASAFVNNVSYATEGYAISPVLDLTGVTGASFSFYHAAKFQTTLRSLCGVVVREEGAKEWTALEIPTWPEAGSWTFVNSGDISLSAYEGKKIQIAFKYASSTAGADTWEIKNVSVKGSK